MGHRIYGGNRHVMFSVWTIDHNAMILILRNIIKRVTFCPDVVTIIMAIFISIGNFESQLTLKSFSQ